MKCVILLPVLLRRDELARVELPWPRELCDTHGTHPRKLRFCPSEAQAQSSSEGAPGLWFAPLTVGAAKFAMYLLAGFGLTDDRVLGLSCLLFLGKS